MRATLLPLVLLAALGLAACNSGSNSANGSDMAGNGSAAATKIPSSVSGKIDVTGDHQPSDNAKLTIKLVDVSAKRNGTLDKKKVDEIGSFPYKFSMDVATDQINPSDLYVIEAEIVDGQRHYTMDRNAPVLTQDAPDNVNIKLKGQPTPDEKLYSDFKDVKGRIGAMKVSQGTAQTDKVSRSYQVFRDKETGNIRYVKELANFVDGNYVETQFAYKHKKPWVVVRKTRSKKGADIKEEQRAGWKGDDLVLKKDIHGDDTSELSKDKAGKLEDDAARVFDKAGNIK